MPIIRLIRRAKLFCFSAAVQQLQQHKDEYSNPVSDSKERQKGAIDILDVLVSHDVLKAYLPNLLAHRDADGYTPFTAAVNIRAYGAALHLWKAIANVTNVGNFLTSSLEKTSNNKILNKQFTLGNSQRTPSYFSALSPPNARIF